MRTREDKEQFFNRLQNEIKSRETLRQSVSEIYLPLLEKFDGKVYNKRFENVLNEALKEVSPLMFANCTMQAAKVQCLATGSSSRSRHDLLLTKN